MPLSGLTDLETFISKRNLLFTYEKPLTRLKQDLFTDYKSVNMDDLSTKNNKSNILIVLFAAATMIAAMLSTSVNLL